MSRKKSTKVVWEKDIECNGVIYHTTITKPIEYGEKKWQIAIHVKVEGLTLHDYSTHFLEGAGAWDGEVLNQQVLSVYGRLINRLPKLNEHHTMWYRKMTMEYFKGEMFDFS